MLDPDTLIYEDDENYSEQYDFEMEEETDNYSMYQDLFDGKDIPTGVEVSMDWFPNSADKESASGSSKSSNKSDVTGNSSKKATKGSGIQSQFSFPDMATPIAQPWNALPHKAGGVIPNSAYALPQNSKAFQPPFTLGSSTSKTYFSNHFQPQTPDTVLGEAPAPAAGSSGLLLPVPPNTPGFKGYGARYRVEEAILPPDASRVKRNMEDFLGLYLFFKRFDIVEDFSDHHYASKGNSSKQVATDEHKLIFVMECYVFQDLTISLSYQHSKEWAKRIQDEWKILEKDLPGIHAVLYINFCSFYKQLFLHSFFFFCFCCYWDRYDICQSL